ncbi:MAG: PspC domain-containing protein [Fulvivirga sp.]|nr:PspC domain-containing protein [Fulvivirga sp.]
MQNKRLTRSKDRKIIAGVLAGIARYYGWEVDKVRLVYLLIAIFSAAVPAIIAYVILWFVMPEV